MAAEEDSFVLIRQGSTCFEESKDICEATSTSSPTKGPTGVLSHNL